jgi:AcrR family transcriptional regulator
MNTMLQANRSADETGEKLDRKHGPKWIRTRQRIMDATAALLADRPLADVRITEITRAAELAQPVFYDYFANMEEAVLAIARDISADSLGVYLEPDWDGEAGLDHARRLVEAAIELWRRHRAIFSIVNVLADNRREGFAAVRVRQMRTIYKSFEAKIRRSQAAGRIDPAITPRLAGYECVVLLGSAGQKHELLLASGFSHSQLVETTARLLYLIANGTAPEQLG